MITTLDSVLPIGRRTANVLSAAAIKQRYGVEKSFLRQILNNQFYIPALFHDCLQHYRLSIITGKEFAARIHEGTLCQQVGQKRVEFSVIYQFCTPAEVKRSAIVNCSFRMAASEIGLEPVVIVRIGGKDQKESK